MNCPRGEKDLFLNLKREGEGRTGTFYFKIQKFKKGRKRDFRKFFGGV